ncbi:trypsin-like serine protease [Pyxidicoccus fallax]|uniref:Trypsin-like serine protease n=1 Tax=Pyxidicoccus fallax TaxID=394095 RepID=A0A848L7N0_9BACT|nr:trypsin-like serine protease [Pyxidicoccus fallax]NMO14272.1 trypsin-like serine protease [Pyxidicoccus fallax]NPC82610.1 trypsin-like serine protease [Pyxidicoccus fallax]
MPTLSTLPLRLSLRRSRHLGAAVLLSVAGLVSQGCESTPPPVEEELAAVDPSSWSGGWKFERQVAQRPLGKDEAITPSGKANLPDGDYLVLGDGRMFRATGDAAMDLPQEMRGGGSWRGDDGGGTPGFLLDSVSQGIVIGTDDRTVVNSDATLQTWPYRAVGPIIYDENATTGTCTATMIGPRHAVTAAHCLHDNAGTWYWPLYFSPGHKGSGADRTPNGAYRKVVARYARTHATAWDYALLILEDKPETANLGYLGFGWWTSDSFYQDRAMRVWGYPVWNNTCAASPLASDDCGGYMYRSSCTISNTTSDVLYHKCDTQGGNSGSAIQSYVGSDLYVLGVHKGYPDSTTNWGPRFTEQKIGDLCDWIEAWPSAYSTRACN